LGCIDELRYLETDQLTTLARRILQNISLRARALSKALEPAAAHSPAGSRWTRHTNIGILGSRYHYFLYTYITGVTPVITTL